MKLLNLKINNCGECPYVAYSENRRGLRNAIVCKRDDLMISLIDLYRKKEDISIPNCCKLPGIKDHDIVQNEHELDYCTKCGKGEIELSGPCEPRKGD